MVIFRALMVLPILLFSRSITFSQELPIGYISYFSHNCNNETLFNFLLPENESEWMIVKEEGQNYLRIKSTNDTASQPFPECRSALNNMILGDFILEFDVKTVPLPDSDTAGFCFLGPIKTGSIYYSMIFSKDTILFFTINHDTIQSCTKKSTSLLNTKWNRIRIQRDILTRTIHIIINDEIQSKVSFSDRILVMGYIGFGSHRSTSYIRNIRLWAPTAIEEKSFQW